MSETKKKIPAIVLLTIDGIKKGINPSEETLEVIFDEIDGNEASFRIAKALLSSLESSTTPVAAPVAAPIQSRGEYQPRQEAAPQKAVLDENTKPLKPADLKAAKGKVSVSKKGWS